MCTGHSFLPRDREFTTIERLKKSANVYVPDDWARVKVRPGNTWTNFDKTVEAVGIINIPPNLF